VLSLHCYSQLPSQLQAEGLERACKYLRKELLLDYQTCRLWVKRFGQSAPLLAQELSLVELKDCIIEDIEEQAKESKIELCTDDFLAIFCYILLEQY
jgi:hypothetical protein